MPTWWDLYLITMLVWLLEFYRWGNWGSGRSICTSPQYRSNGRPGWAWNPGLLNSIPVLFPLYVMLPKQTPSTEIKRKYRLCKCYTKHTRKLYGSIKYTKMQSWGQVGQVTRIEHVQITGVNFNMPSLFKENNLWGILILC